MEALVSIEKIYQMYGRVSMERDLLAEENQQLAMKIKKMEGDHPKPDFKSKKKDTENK